MAEPDAPSDRPPRNDAVVDAWSFVHLASGILAGWLLPPFLALVLLILWEPVEVLIISPLMWRWKRRVFGHESLRNVASDVLFDVAGVAIGHYALGAVVESPLPW